MTESAMGNLRPMRERDLEQVLSWRNHPEVRRYMYTQHEISTEEHARWFVKASRSQTRHLLIYEDDAKPLGFVNIKQIGDGGIAEWGFYTSPNAPKGTGTRLGQAAIRYAFEAIHLHKICGKALAFNHRSISFHLKLGFEREGVLRQQHFDGQGYHDVICFGLIVNE